MKNLLIFLFTFCTLLSFGQNETRQIERKGFVIGIKNGCLQSRSCRPLTSTKSHQNVHNVISGRLPRISTPSLHCQYRYNL